MDEQTLLAALRRRDPDAFSQLFETHSDKIYRLAVGLLQNETEADGVVQDTFMRLIERLDQFEGRAKLSTWLYRVAYNLCQDRLRQKRPLFPLSNDQNDETLPIPTIFIDWQTLPEQCLTTTELNAELDKAIASLPPKLKAVFILREIEGVSTQACADALSISLSTTKVRLHRARLLLREHLAAYFAERVV